MEASLANLQQQLDDLRQQVVESQRLATLGTLAAVVAHEFNNLLTPIVSYSQYALESAMSDKPDMELIRKALAKGMASAERAGRICRSILGMARGEASQTGQMVEVQRLIDETLLVLARDPKKDGIALRVQVEPELAVPGEAVELEQVLLNLLINARQAMLGRGGALTVKAGRDPKTGEVRIAVIDTGPGIPERVRERIFEPFFTTRGTTRRGEARGTGLGLHICRQLVEHHGGRIELQSEVGRGTTFTVILPGSPQPAREVA
jgi:two-component system NtrC family sensor kinase